MKSLEEYQRVSIPDDIAKTRLTLAYLAGMFDAEGSVGIYYLATKQYQKSCEFAQKSSPLLLQVINQKFNAKGSQSADGKLRFQDEAAVHVLGEILPYSQKKKPEIEYFIKCVRESKLIDLIHSRGAFFRTTCFSPDATGTKWI